MCVSLTGNFNNVLLKTRLTCMYVCCVFLTVYFLTSGVPRVGLGGYYEYYRVVQVLWAL